MKWQRQQEKEKKIISNGEIKQITKIFSHEREKENGIEGNIYTENYVKRHSGKKVEKKLFFTL